MMDCSSVSRLGILAFASWAPGRCVLRAAIGLAFVLLAGVGAGNAQTTGADLVLHRTVTYADRQTYIEVPFDVGEGVTRITVDCSYTERDKHTVIDLGMFDGERFRGWSGEQKFLHDLGDGCYALVSAGTDSSGTVEADPWGSEYREGCALGVYGYDSFRAKG